MKKAVFFAALVSVFLFSAARADDISVIIDGSELESGAAPVMIDDRVLVPMRAIFEALGADVEWDEASRSVLAVKDADAVKITIDSDVISAGIVNSDNAEVFSSKIRIDVPARIIDDRTYVPARAVAEAFKSDVSWDGDNRRVIIDSPKASDKVFFYASADDYGKLYSVDYNGASKRRLSDKSVKEIYYDSGFIYYIADDNRLYRQPAGGGEEVMLTDYDTEVVSISNGKIFCLKKEAEHKGVMYEISSDPVDFSYLMYPERHGNYIYYNRAGDARMVALNLDTYEETVVDMGSGVTLSPFQCVFYGDYILVEDGVGYKDACRFYADGSGMDHLNNENTVICRSQEYDDRILYVNGDTQDIFCLWIDGSYEGRVVDMPDDCVYSDVLWQSGDYIYYKNMYRGEIYRTNFDAAENICVGVGSELKVEDGIMVISGDGMYMGNPDGTELVSVYGKTMNDYFISDGRLYGTDSVQGNIVRTGRDANVRNITNDRVIAWCDNIQD